MSNESGKQWLFIGVGILMILAIFGAPIADKVGSFEVGGKVWDVSWMGSFASTVGEYLFGIKPGETSTGLGGLDLSSYAFTVIFLMIWLIIFVTFGDILEAFSSFSPAISWVIAFCFAVIGGLTGAYGGFVGMVTSWFITFGALAVYFGLGSAFIIFLLIETGLGFFIPRFKEFAQQRKVMQEELSAKGHLKSAASAAKALESFGEEIRK